MSETENKEEVKLGGILPSIFNSDKIPRWSLGVAAIVIVLTVLFNGLNLGTIIQNKLENDNALQLQIINQRYQSDLQAMNTLVNLNEELNDRLQNVLTAYNEQAVTNSQLSDSNLKLNREVDALKIQLSSKDLAISALEQSNRELNDKVLLLTSQNEDLQKQIDTLNRRIDTLFSQIQEEPLP
jgi:chromosome segregation ATPase